MPWLSDTLDAIAWMASSAEGGGNPQQIQQGFQSMQVSAGDFASWYNYQLTNQPKPRYGFETPFMPFMNALTQWLTTSPQQQPGQQGQAPGATGKPPSAASGPIPGFNGDPAVVQAIIKAAQDTGVDPRLALAIAQHESNFRANAVSGNGCDRGVFQLNTCGGEGVGVPDYLINDPYSNAKIALSKVAQVQREHPDWTPGQIAQGAQRADNTNNRYVDAINQNMNSIQTGQGDLAWANAALQGTQYGGLGSTANQFQGGSSVPLPFSVDYFRRVTEAYGESFQGSTEQGTDFGMPVGTQINTPVGGTIKLRDDGKANWGKAVYVEMPNGWKFFVGHLTSFAVTDGQTVSPGSVIGVSGGDPNDPSSGHSSGPHVEVQFIDPSNHPIDPMPFLNQLFAGTTFGSWAGGAFLGSAQVQGQAQNLARTPDNQIVDYNTPSGAWYKTVDSVWTAIYGQHAPLQAAVDFRKAGYNTVDSLQLAINNLPSSIPGVTIGQYKSVSDATQKQALQSFGRAVPQSLVQQLIQNGITNAGDIQLWFQDHGSGAIPKDQYQQVFDSSVSYTQNLYGDVPHPTDIQAIYNAAGGSAPSTGSTDPIVKTIQDFGAGVY